MLGALNIDKPEGITSHDAVNQIRKLTGERRVGHGGTLDPFATGVLIVAIGKATRLLEYMRDLQKTYRTAFVLGATSDTDDTDGEITKTEITKTKQITKTEITNHLKQFIGEIEQIPPAYSAVKIQGQKLYEIARAGKSAAAKPRRVTVYDIKFVRYEYPELELEITCGSGTYIRAIARDLGKNLGIGGYAKELRRTQIGAFSAENSVPLDKLTKENIAEHILPPETLVTHLPRIELQADQIKDFKQGKAIAMTRYEHSPTRPLAVFSADQLIGIGTVTDNHLQPDKVLIA